MAVDAHPQNEQWLETYCDADAVFSYSDWGGEVIKEETNNNAKYIKTAPPSADSAYIPVEDKIKHKEKMGFSADSLIIGTVMRNQKRKLFPDPKYKSLTVSKFINAIMYDGKRSSAEKILYTAMDKMKNKNVDPIKTFNSAVTNVRPNLEVRSRRVGGATYQVPVEVKTNRSQALALDGFYQLQEKEKIKK